uniref:Uncharacterized protein n=1 Tax=Glossina brevipalpis TaxID=37001 RepID=A0A1A9WUJ0_9MUSC
MKKKKTKRSRTCTQYYKDKRIKQEESLCHSSVFHLKQVVNSHVDERADYIHNSTYAVYRILLYIMQSYMYPCGYVQYSKLSYVRSHNYKLSNHSKLFFGHALITEPVEY